MAESRIWETSINQHRSWQDRNPGRIAVEAAHGIATRFVWGLVFSSRHRAETRSFLHGVQGTLHVYGLPDEALVYKSAAHLANDGCVSDSDSFHPSRRSLSLSLSLSLCLIASHLFHEVRPQCVKEEFERQRARWHLPPPQPSRTAGAPPQLSCCAMLCLARNGVL